MLFDLRWGGGVRAGHQYVGWSLVVSYKGSGRDVLGLGGFDGVAGVEDGLFGWFCLLEETSGKDNGVGRDQDERFVCMYEGIGYHS